MKRKWIWLTLSLLLLAGGYVGYMYNEIESTANDTMKEDTAGIDSEQTEAKTKEKKPLNVLLMGVDERQGDRGRSDTLLVLSIRPEEEKTVMISIPRDTRTTLAGDEPEAGAKDKINHAYAFGGTDMAVETVESFLDTEMDYYAKINMEGLVDLVEAVGGITVTNSRSFTQGGIQFDKGNITLSGKEALAYVRMRKQDPEGDIGRNERQRQVISAITGKLASFQSIKKSSKLLNVAGDNIKTNADFNLMRDMLINYRSAREHIETYQITGTNEIIDGIYYLEPLQEDVETAHSLVSYGQS